MFNYLLRSSYLYIVNIKRRPTKPWCLKRLQACALQPVLAGSAGHKATALLLPMNNYTDSHHSQGDINWGHINFANKILRLKYWINFFIKGQIAFQFEYIFMIYSAPRILIWRHLMISQQSLLVILERYLVLFCTQGYAPFKPPLVLSRGYRPLT